MGKEEHLYGFLGTQSSGNQTWQCLLGFSSKWAFLFCKSFTSQDLVLQNIGVREI